MILPGVWGFVGTPFSEDVAVAVGNAYSVRCVFGGNAFTWICGPFKW